MCMYRHNRGEILEVPHKVQYIDTSFSDRGYVLENMSHQWKEKGNSLYRYRGSTLREKYLARPIALRSLRVDQWFRYFEPLPKYYATKLQHEREARLKRGNRNNLTKRGYTFQKRRLHDIQDDRTQHDKYFET